MGFRSVEGAALAFVSFVMFDSRFAFADDYSFDDQLLIGTHVSGDNINGANHAVPGVYHVDLYVNEDFLSSAPVKFVDSENEGRAEPCFSDDFLSQSVRVKIKELKADSDSISKDDAGKRHGACNPMSQRLPGASFQLDIARLRLNLSIPRAILDIKPRGYVSPDDWQSGESMFFSNYDANYYRSSFDSGSDDHADNGYFGINSGFNVGLWRLRHQSNYSYSSGSGGSSGDWNSIRTYAQRALPSLRSELTLGESYSAGNLFGSLGYRGIQLKSDDRMLPDSQRNYAPQIHGVAKTNARVIVRQDGRRIYETSVAPGAFIIEDLYGTNYAGDLDVEVVESDGSSSTFTVPFSSVPESMRPGQSKYSLSLGEARDYGDGHDLFGDVIYQRGVNNRVTLNTGARLAEDYVALLGGGVLATEFGAFGFDSTFSTAVVAQGEREQGWRFGLSYSRTFQPTSTTLTLAGYRYSTEGFRDLGDVLGERAAESDSDTWSSDSFMQRNQFTITVSQSLGGYGNLYLSGSASDYYDGKSRDNQFQFGYSGNYGDLSYNISYTKQESTHLNDSSYYSQDAEMASVGQSDSYQTNSNTLLLSVSLPLGRSSNAPLFSSSVSRNSGDEQSTNYQAGLSGSGGKDNTLSYGVNMGYEPDGQGTDWNGTIQKQMPFATLGAGYSQGQDYRQINGSIRGAAVIHREGVTLGPYLGDTFALIEAKGATGAGVLGGQGAKIDNLGYALVPSLSPYRYNSIGLDPQGIDDQAELLETERKVAPYAGAAVKVKFKTQFGNAFLIKSKLTSGALLPMGANVIENGVSVGMVGQGGQVYARTESEYGQFRVRWGDSAKDECILPYDVRGRVGSEALIRLEGTCTPITAIKI